MLCCRSGAAMVKKLLRTAQTYFPGLQDVRFTTQMKLFRALGRPYRPQYWAMRSFQAETPLLVDVGASRGMSIATLRTMQPDADIIGFEANIHIAEQTRKLFQEDTRIRIEPVGLGAKDDELTLYVPVYQGYRFDGLASLSRSEAADWLPGRIVGFDRAKLELEELRVHVRPLDSYNLAPFLLKMYVQGYETQVLLGSTNTIDAHRPVIIAPGHQGHVDAFLQKYGYRRYAWIDGHFVAEGNSPFVVFYMTSAHLAVVRPENAPADTPAAA